MRSNVTRAAMGPRAPSADRAPGHFARKPASRSNHVAPEGEIFVVSQSAYDPFGPAVLYSGQMDTAVIPAASVADTHAPAMSLLPIAGSLSYPMLISSSGT